MPVGEGMSGEKKGREMGVCQNVGGMGARGRVLACRGLGSDHESAEDEVWRPHQLSKGARVLVGLGDTHIERTREECAQWRKRKKQ